MKKVVLSSVAILFVVGVTAVVVRLWLRDVTDVSAVETIIRTPQTYDGEHIDRLVALGPSDIPAIGQVLSNGPEFPLVLVLALERIGDSRGAQPILIFIEGRAPFSSAESSSGTARAIQALRSVPSADSCAPLADEASDILLDVLSSTYSAQILFPVIEFAERQEDGRFSNALLIVLENTALVPEARLAAARALLNRADLPDDVLANGIREFRMEAERYGYPSKIIDEARRLSE